jgi:hypothetical protein
MGLRALALDWSLDGPVGVTFLVLVVALAVLYLLACRCSQPSYWSRTCRRSTGWR